MTTTAISAIQTALAQLPGQNFAAAATELLASLGYRSELVPPSQADNVEYFIQTYKASNPGTRSENDFVENTKSVRILFQVADREIAPTQGALFETGGFSAGNVKSFFFVAVELKEAGYSRGSYAAFAREINKRWPIPTVVLFKTSSNLLTLAFMPRRRNRRNESSSVLGSVSLIREIDPANPHRAHLDILAELSLADRLVWMDQHGQQRNFDGLLAAWLDTLDTEELNRRFYQDLFGWFQRAVDTARFPTDQAKNPTPEEHVIRLITRLLFVWFIKEKGLVAEDLFVENQVRGLLKDYAPATGDSYYRAVLQNLFFATLNTEMNRRGFSPGGGNAHPESSLYRYADQIADLDGLLARFEQTPFINGGLFDCLDSFGDTGDGGYRIDCFSDVHYHLLSIPNRLFFGQDSNTPGLITLFNRYKFTVEENTPAEQEVALDPELLGKVFENLLAAYNPETRENARKQTGSYYTPRPVVDYMVDEALVASLAQKAQPQDGDAQAWEGKLRSLLDYQEAVEDDGEEPFTDAEQAGIVRAIAELKVLDPAVGSGAFPMGVLHKLTLALRRLDPDNSRWQALQQELHGRRAAATFRTDDGQERGTELQEINDTFERYRTSDFGRKLYLIQNSIYGVDLQPVATQIAKLRFFISLAIDQQPTDDPADNYGIKPLPNLETRFVAADTLLRLHNLQGTLASPRVEELQDSLKVNRERHFHANTRSKKLACLKDDRRLRSLLAEELKSLGMPSGDADKYVQWDPYEQNSSADWFDPEYMFAVKGGFDVVIGNPPYRQVNKGIYPELTFPYSEGRDKGKQNLYKLFVEQSFNLCKDGGIATLIVQSSLMCDLSSAATRQLLIDHTRLQHVIEFPKAASTRDAQLFQSVTQGTCVYQFLKATPDVNSIRISVGNDSYTIEDLHFAEITRTTIGTLYPELRCFPRIGRGSVAILEKIAGDKNIKPLKGYASKITQGDLNLTTHSKRFSHKPTSVLLLRGRNVGRFVIKYDTSSEYCEKGFMADRVNANRQASFLISQEVTGTNDIRRLHFGLAESPPMDFLCGHSVNKTLLKDQTHSKAFLAVLNSKFMDWFFRITSTNNHVQGYELEQLPIPSITASDRQKLTRLVDRILKAKEADAKADTSALEAEIDRLVYDLYGLTEEEIAAVEG